MGYIINASCALCGFSVRVDFGAGMKNTSTTCRVPAINKKTGEMTTINYFPYAEFKRKGMHEKLAESEYLFYTEPEMTRCPDSGSKFKWDDIAIYTEQNYCPQCKNFSLRFRGIGLFD